MAREDAPTTRTAGRVASAAVGRRRLVGVAVALALGAAACGGGDHGDGAVAIEATPAALAEAAQRSASQPYRMEASLEMRAAAGGEELDIDAPFLTGVVNGQAFDMRMDMADWLDQLAAADPTGSLDRDLDLTMDMVGDTETLYVRARLFASLADTLPPGADAEAFVELGDLGDQWGQVDLTALDELSIANLQTTAGAAGGNDPRVLLDLVASADDVEALDDAELDGSDVAGLGANVSLGQMLEAQGVDADAFLDQLTGGFGATAGANTADEQELVGDLTTAIFETAIPFEVWVDDAGLVRRVSYEMNVADITRQVAAARGEAAPPLDDFVIGSTMDFSDYGAEDIEIEFPSDAVDVTDTYRRILELGSGSS